MYSANLRPLILSPGDRLGGYTVDEVLGIGGMAVVYSATQHSLRRRVALKVLDRRLSEQDGFQERFRREGALVASLDHPNIVPVYDSGEDEGRLYLAMRLVEGETLADRMRRPGLSAGETAAILTQLGGALDLAHEVGVLHRDVKPQNILLAGDRPYLADFGVAKSTDAHTATGTGGFLGSVHYASPEQIRGEPLDGRTDSYSLAAVAFECLTGGAPFDRPSEAGVMHAHLEEPPPPLPGRLGAGARDLSRALAAGLAKDRNQRPATPGALAASIGAAVARLGRAEQARRPAFPLPAGAGTRTGAGTAAPAAETADVPLPPGPGQALTLDLAAVAPAGPVAGATIVDRRAELQPAVVAPPARDRRRRLAAVGGVLVLLVAGGGVALLRGGDDAAADHRVTLLGASVAVPAAWPGAVSDGTEATATLLGGARTEPAARTTAGAGTTLVSATLRRGTSLRPARATGAPSVVDTGGQTRIFWSVRRGGAKAGTARVLVLPAASGGGVVVGCGAAAGAPAPEACERLLASARLQARGVTAAQRAAATRAERAALQPFTTVTAALPASGEARRAAARHRADLARAGGKRLAAAAPWDGDALAAARAATDLGSAYDRIARAVINRDRAADATERVDLRAADRQLRTSLGLLRARTEGLPRLRQQRVPALVVPKRKKAAAEPEAAAAAAPATAQTTVSPVISGGSTARSSAPKRGSSSGSSKSKRPSVVVVSPSDTE